jgi:hypothetical protein
MRVRTPPAAPPRPAAPGHHWSFPAKPCSDIAARHADSRTTMRYDRARQTLDRHPNYILAAYMASGT